MIKKLFDFAYGQKIFRGKETYVDKLVQDGADINHQDADGNTALHQATERSYERIQFFLKNGANPLIKNKNGEDALNKVLMNGLSRNKKAQSVLKILLNSHEYDVRHGIEADTDQVQKMLNNSNFHASVLEAIFTDSRREAGLNDGINVEQIKLMLKNSNREDLLEFMDNYQEQKQGADEVLSVMLKRNASMASEIFDDRRDSAIAEKKEDGAELKPHSSASEDSDDLLPPPMPVVLEGSGNESEDSDDLPPPPLPSVRDPRSEKGSKSKVRGNGA